MDQVLRRVALTIHDRITGRHILARLEELNRTQWLSRDELMALQRAKLVSLVEYADKYVPYYQRVFKDVGFQPEDLRQDLAYLNRIPILTKAIIRSNFNDLLTTEPVRRAQLSELCTSGSTGQPLVFMQDNDFRDAVTADIQRHLGWAGCNLGDLHTLVWCAAAHPSMKWKIRTGSIDMIWNRFRLNAYEMSEANMAAFAERINREHPKVLFGFANDLQSFARYIRKSRFSNITFSGVFSTAELLTFPVRQFIEDTFRCKVFDRYGTFELGGVGCECEAHDGYHLSSENNYAEILTDGRPAGPNEVGDLVVTNLNNRGMPFIRYAISDEGSWAADSSCACGRSSPRIQTLAGRIRDAFKTRDGRTIFTGFSGHAFLCLAHPEILQFQVVQKNLDLFIVRLVYVGDPPQRILDDITRAFQGTFGDNVNVEFEFFEKIPELPSGKHQYVLSELNQ